MAKKRAKMDNKGLKVAGIGIRRQATVADVARGAPPRLNLAVEFENPGDVPLHVWTSVQGFDYDTATRVLTVHLAERTRVRPPGITVISEHPRTPQQIEVPPKGRATINLELPGS